MTLSQSKVTRFEDLFVWKKSRELANSVYSATNGLTFKDKSLADQIRRASVSVVSNIAEGFERGSKEELLYFLYIARGSCGEVRAQLYIALDQQYITKQDFERMSDMADHTSRLLAKFIEGVKLKGKSGQKFIKPVDKDKQAFENYLQSLVPQKYQNS